MKSKLLGCALCLLLLDVLSDCKCIGCHATKPHTIQSQTLYLHRVMSYVELKPGMSLAFSRLESLPFWEPSRDSKVGQFISNIRGTPGGLSDFLYPGTIVSENTDINSYPKYGEIYNQERYDQICRDLGDQIQERACEFIDQYHHKEYLPECPGVHLGVLFNRIDSLQIVCLDQPFSGVQPGQSLNDKFTISGYFLDFNATEKCTYSGQSIKPASKPFTVNLSEFHQKTGGVQFLSITSWAYVFKPMPCTANSPPSISLAEGVSVAPGTYTFKLTFYLDGGNLTVKSNEIRETF